MGQFSTHLGLAIAIAAILSHHAAHGQNDIAVKAMRNVCLVYYEVGHVTAMLVVQSL